VGDLLWISNAGTTWVSLTSFVNSGQITGTIPAAALASAGSIFISVQSQVTGAFSTPFSFSVAASAPATLSAAIVNAASFLPAIAPGSLISIYGTNLSAITAAAGYPLPVALAGTSVSINGGSVPLLFVSPAQINAQVPYEITPGAATLLIQSQGQSSTAVTFAVAATGPGVITVPGGSHVLAVNDADGSLNSAGNPMRPGQYVTLWVIGQGLVNPPLATGAAAPANPLSRPVAAVTATIGGQPVDIQLAGMAPGFTGLMQMNVTMPDAPAGEQPFQVAIGGVASNITTISVAN
jgi:uncharacterized protein (TIGR03437 family)